MAITDPHLHWFNLKCPYPQNSTAYKAAKARLHNASYADLERLRSEFDTYRDGSTPFTHYKIYDEWFASIGGVRTHQVNMKGIQRHGTKYRVQKRVNGQLRRWTCNTLDDAIKKGILSLVK